MSVLFAAWLYKWGGGWAFGVLAGSCCLEWSTNNTRKKHQQTVLHGNRTRSSILSRGTEPSQLATRPRGPKTKMIKTLCLENKFQHSHTKTIISTKEINEIIKCIAISRYIISGQFPTLNSVHSMALTGFLRGIQINVDIEVMCTIC